MCFAGRFQGSINTSLGLVDGGECDIRIGLLIGSLHRFESFLELTTSPIGLDIVPEFGMISQYSHVIVEHLNETAVNGEHVLSASGVVSEDTGS